MTHRPSDERRLTLVEGGWVGWLPRKTQHLLGLIADMEDRGILGPPSLEMSGVRVSTLGVEPLARVYESLGGPAGDAWEYDDPSGAETQEEADYDHLRRYDLLDRAERLAAKGFPRVHTNADLLELLCALGLVSTEAHTGQWRVVVPPPRPGSVVELTPDEHAADEDAVERNRHAPQAARLRQLFMRIPLRQLELPASDWAAAVGGSVSELASLITHLVHAEGEVFSLDAVTPPAQWSADPHTLVRITLDWHAWLRERRYLDEAVGEILLERGWVSAEELEAYIDAWDVG